MNLLITGASGYIGTNLCQKLHLDGNQISIIKRKSSKTSSIDQIVSKEWNIDDLQEDFNQIFLYEKYDAVIHLATLFQVDHRYQDIPGLVDSNFTFGLKLVDAMTRNGCLKLINFTSSWQNYSQDDTSPVNLYSAIKRSFTEAIKFYDSSHGLKVLNLRIYDSYGPNDSRRKIIPLLQKALFDNTPIDLSPGQQLIDLVHIDDICRGVSVALSHLNNKNFVSSEFALATFKPLSLKEITHTLARINCKEQLLNYGGRPYRNREVMKPYYPFPILPNWQPEIDLEQGLKSLIKFHGN